MPVPKWAMCLTVALAALGATAPRARAEPLQPVRTIEITKENAERSAAAIAAAKNPFIGAPPPGIIVRRESDWRNARAQAPDSEADVESPVPAQLTANASDRAVVQIIKPGKTGPVVENWVVPRGR